MRHRRSLLTRGLGPVVTVVLAVTACGGGSSLTAACDDVVDDELDPGWTLHLLPSAPEPEYLTEPPTSGPHYAAEPASGVVDEPLDRPSQVTVLEVGGVLVQYRPDDLSTDDRSRLERLIEDGVVVAPAPDLDDPVVATAWTATQRCQGVAIDALSAFVMDHAGQGPATAG
jgi:hypothetical protein